MKVIVANIFGKVQGVWFRKYTFEKAKDLNIVGIVKNLNNGSVLVKFSGEKKNIDKFKKWLIIGSPLSKVENINFSFKNISSNYSSFKIDY